jgi:hypothetical protein
MQLGEFMETQYYPGYVYFAKVSPKTVKVGETVEVKRRMSLLKCQCIGIAPELLHVIKTDNRYELENFFLFRYNQYLARQREWFNADIVDDVLQISTISNVNFESVDKDLYWKYFNNRLEYYATGKLTYLRKAIKYQNKILGVSLHNKAMQATAPVVGSFQLFTTAQMSFQFQRSCPQGRSA